MSSLNPLFPDDTNQPDKKDGFLLPGNNKRVEPLTGKHNNPAVDLIRHKIDSLYAGEPDAKEELREAAEQPAPRSRHQQFMFELSTSGKSLAHIQTEWHNYYANLTDHEKHQVWQEFYQANERHPSNFTKFVQKHSTRPTTATARMPAILPPHDEQAAAKNQAFVSRIDTAPSLAESGRGSGRPRTVADLKKRVLRKVRARSAAQIKAKKHLQSLLFGLSLGAISIVIFLFGFFNQMVIAPFIQPSGKASATPIILSTDGIAPSADPELIIPKINVQLPVIYNLASADEAAIQKGLESGVIHYPNTVIPGQQGNAAFFGHSSNNIFNKGKYKFAFVLLREMVPGDIFYLTYEGRVYSYKVFQKKVVEPTETWVLGPVEGKPATVALITCDPPGTSSKRLVVWGEQVSPDPTGNAAAPAQPEQATEALPSEGPSAWSRFWGWVTPW